MDRDFVLTVKAPQATHSFAIYGADGEGAAAIASFQPLFPGLRQPRPLELAIVIDCSGSMQGDSIEQARQALAGILDALEPRDRVTIVAFGSTTRRLSDRLLPCTAANLEKARRFAHELKADLGGTAQRAVESLHEHARRTETELRAMVDQAGALLSEIDTIQSSADVLRRTIDEMQSRASHERATTKDAVDQLLVLLVKLKELIARLQERRTLLGQLQEAAREWTEVAKRYRHLTRGGG
jgi:chromosome segregation ATPase